VFDEQVIMTNGETGGDYNMRLIAASNRAAQRHHANQVKEVFRRSGWRWR